jgi:GAF domain-containing protein
LYPVTPLEPIPETVEAINELDPSQDDEGDLLASLTDLANRAQEIVPDLVGCSIGRLEHGLTLTLVATTAEVAVLDAVQYVGGGPCVEAAHEEEVKEFHQDGLDEEQWRLFAELTASLAVRSTLTLPVVNDERVVGTVNLYAASRRAFVGHHEQLALLFGAWAAGAVENADLSFTTRREAERAPQHVREQQQIAVATGIVSGLLRLDVETAGEQLREAALRAGVPLVQLARDIIRARERRHQDSD